MCPRTVPYNCCKAGSSNTLHRDQHNYCQLEENHYTLIYMLQSCIVYRQRVSRVAILRLALFCESAKLLASAADEVLKRRLGTAHTWPVIAIRKLLGALVHQHPEVVAFIVSEAVARELLNRNVGQERQDDRRSPHTVVVWRSQGHGCIRVVGSRVLRVVEETESDDHGRR